MPAYGVNLVGLNSIATYEELLKTDNLKPTYHTRTATFLRNKPTNDTVCTYWYV